MGLLQKKYNEEVAKKLKSELGLANTMAVPRMEKIILNMGMAGAMKDEKILDEAVAQLTLIAGQKPVVTKAKRAIAGFKLRQGDKIGAMVTLRGGRMYDFFERLIHVVLPRVRDFGGVSTTSFDGHGNYSMGFHEISIFPEIEGAAAGKAIGMEMTIKTTARNDDGARALLTALGMPFKKVKS